MIQFWIHSKTKCNEGTISFGTISFNHPLETTVWSCLALEYVPYCHIQEALHESTNRVGILDR